MSTSRDLELISAYVDGEVPEPWNSRMPEFIEADPARRAGLERLRSVRSLLQSVEPGDVPAAQDRVWETLQQHPASGRIPWWHRAVQIPLPAAAAIAAVFIGFAFFSLRTPSGPLPDMQLQPEGRSALVSSQPQSTDQTASQVGSDLQLQVQVESIDQLLELLAAQNVVRDVTINLPKDSTLGIHGEPALLKASEVGLRGGR